jgi:hypothetical protein
MHGDIPWMLPDGYRAIDTYELFNRPRFMSISKNIFFVDGLTSTVAGTAVALVFAEKLHRNVEEKFYAHTININNHPARCSRACIIYLFKRFVFG